MYRRSRSETEQSPVVDNIIHFLDKMMDKSPGPNIFSFILSFSWNAVDTFRQENSIRAIEKNTLNRRNEPRIPCTFIMSHSQDNSKTHLLYIRTRLCPLHIYIKLLLLPFNNKRQGNLSIAPHCKSNICTLARTENHLYVIRVTHSGHFADPAFYQIVHVPSSYITASTSISSCPRRAPTKFPYIQGALLLRRTSFSM